MDLFRPIRLRKAYEEVVAVLADVIRGGLYAPGDVLPNERDLAMRLDVSRAVVREALEALKAHGAVSARRGRGGGTVVESVAAVARLQSSLRAGTTANLRSLLEYRRVLERTSAVLAATRAEKSALQGLQRHVDALSEATDLPADENLEIDMRFHVALAQLSGNEPLATDLRHNLESVIHARSFFPFGRVEANAAADNQQRYLDAILAGKPARVVRAVDEHLSAFEDVVLGLRLGFPDSA